MISLLTVVPEDTTKQPDILPESTVFVEHGCVHLEKMHPFT